MSEEINKFPMVAITITKVTTVNPPHGSPSRAFLFSGERLTPSDQRDLIECLASDLVRRLDDCRERHGSHHSTEGQDEHI